MSHHALPNGKGLLEEALLTRLLHSFITKLESSRSRLSIKISKKTAPELFQSNHYDVPYLWMLITSLESEYQVLRITPAPKAYTKEAYEGATLVFNRDQEALVRYWLKRPVHISDAQQWQQALRERADRFTPEQIRILSENRIQHNNKTALEVLDALECIGDELTASTVPLSCRTLSTRCFDGDSKFLDRRECMLRQLFPEGQHKLKTRPILLSIALPSVINSVLFIENQDTFLACVEQHQHALIVNTALVYSAGFRGAAERGRNRGEIAFAFVDVTSSDMRENFEQWWHNDQQAWPCYFWGDLDYDGMRILATLRNVFSSMQAWEPGYKAMVHYHQEGVSHAPEAAKKEGQKRLEATGCNFADTTLLPILHSSQRFLDQEVIASLEESCVPKPNNGI